jgi:hypothetical protein
VLSRRLPEVNPGEQVWQELRAKLSWLRLAYIEFLEDEVLSWVARYPAASEQRSVARRRHLGGLGGRRATRRWRKSIVWLLLTTVPVTTRQEALERVAWYACRWGIEVWHKVLKSGCQIEAWQLGTAARLERCLALYAVIAWRCMRRC